MDYCVAKDCKSQLWSHISLKGITKPNNRPIKSVTLTLTKVMRASITDQVLYTVDKSTCLHKMHISGRPTIRLMIVMCFQVFMVSNTSGSNSMVNKVSLVFYCIKIVALLKRCKLNFLIIKLGYSIWLDLNFWVLSFDFKQFTTSCKDLWCIATKLFEVFRSHHRCYCKATHHRPHPNHYHERWPFTVVSGHLWMPFRVACRYFEWSLLNHRLVWWWKITRCNLIDTI